MAEPPKRGTALRSASDRDTAASPSQTATSTRPGILRKASACACGGTCPRCRAGSHAGASPTLQAKLPIGEPNDPLERMADTVAEDVLRMPEPNSELGNSQATQSGAINERLQMKPANTASAGDSAPPIIHDVLRDPGQPLDASTRAFMEPRFGHDFSSVRIHADRRAEDAAQSVDALAFTVGPHIVFGGENRPSSSSGQQLLAHELTHVVQQSSGPSRLQRAPKKKKPAPPAPPAGGNILYVGMNNSKLELEKLDKVYKGKSVDITRVTLAEDTAHTQSGGQTFDLTSDTGIDDFVKSLGLNGAEAATAGGLLKSAPVMADRDDMAHVMAVYAMTEADGKDRMSRVVLSGHSSGESIMDKPPFENHIRFKYLVALAAIFPAAAGQTKHVIVSACRAGVEDSINDVFKKAFPNMITFMGWTESCPTDAGGAAAIGAWAKTTDPDPTQLDAPPTGRSNWASGKYQGVEHSSPTDTMNNLRADEAQFQKYFDGDSVDKDEHRGWLTTYYGQALSAALNTQAITGADHDYAYLHAQQALGLRFWKSKVGKFVDDNRTALQGAYGKAGVPDFKKMGRKAVLQKIKTFATDAQGPDDLKKAAQILLDGLISLDKDPL